MQRCSTSRRALLAAALAALAFFAAFAEASRGGQEFWTHGSSLHQAGRADQAAAAGAPRHAGGSRGSACLRPSVAPGPQRPRAPTPRTACERYQLSTTRDIPEQKQAGSQRLGGADSPAGSLAPNARHLATRTQAMEAGALLHAHARQGAGSRLQAAMLAVKQ